MHISSAVFTVSSQKLSQCPTDGLPEFALIGRSNVGKSSLINMLTDLVATALGSCMMTIMGIAAQTHGIDIDGTKLHITKIMSASPRRIGEIVVEVHFPKPIADPKQREILERAAATCPVAQSLHPDCKQTVSYRYGE